MMRLIASSVMALGLVAATAVAQMPEAPPQPQIPAPAPTQEQVEQPAPDHERLPESALDRTQAAQDLPGVQAPDQQTAAAAMADFRQSAQEAHQEWQEHFQQNASALEGNSELQEAWMQTQQAYTALQMAAPQDWQQAQANYRASLENLRETWDAVD